MTRKELMRVPKRDPCETLLNVAGVYVIPSGRKHESGWACMDFVATFYDRPMVRFGGKCDSVSFDGFHFHMDCTYPNRVVHIWNVYPFHISQDSDTIHFLEQVG